MPEQGDARFLAKLVYGGLLSAEAVHRAMASGGDLGANLIRNGDTTAEQWQEWLLTDAGTRPQLSRYELRELLGEGGTARVFRALDRKTGSVVALKLLKPELAQDVPSARRFVREAQLLISLSSPQVVKGLRVAKEGHHLFCVMELVEGRCLQELLDQQGRLQEDFALGIVCQVARALAHLHERGLVHRDVKPGNVIVDDNGSAVLIDLGFAVPLETGDQVSSETTSGTAAYISPEQAKGESTLDVRADIYSLGATLYHLVTGALPFSGHTSEEILARQVLDSLSGEAIRTLGLTPQVHWLIEKCMAKERGIRFQDPKQLIAEIESLLAQRAAEKSADDEAKRPRRRRRLF